MHFSSVHADNKAKCRCVALGVIATFAMTLGASVQGAKAESNDLPGGLSSEEISRMMDNPVGELIMLPVQYDFTRVEGPNTGGARTVSNIKVIPTFPVQMGDWNLINRIAFSFPILPVDDDYPAFATQAPETVVGTPGAAAPPGVNPFDGRTEGFGDLVYVGLLSPKSSIKTKNASIIWGVGPTVIFPTASKDVLGQGKYQIGPAAVVGYLGKEWTLGLFGQHWRSIAGDDSRSDVQQTNVQYFIYKKLRNQWSVGASPTITISQSDISGETLLNIPIGVGVNKTLFLGKLPARVGVELHYYAIHEDTTIAPRWGMRFSITPVVPAAMLRR